ncbi:MAG TPA: hypothetical protein VFW34_07165 [Candidatus Rubrimentiphilum sp.]|nr:hypothetical protein [Candidatus Rubrimentiphilum sp.]
MKNTTPKIDRATLLKGGGTAALAAVLAGSLESRAEACCFPIDLSYGDSLTSLASTTSVTEKTSARKRRTGATEFTAVRIWAPKPGGGGTAQPTAPWTLLFTAANAEVNGNDENGSKHGNNGKPKALGGEIWVYVK